jgi:hypothetical protein
MAAITGLKRSGFPLKEHRTKNARAALIAASLILTGAFEALPPAGAEDYQYQYFSEKKEYTPFSDYIPRVRQHYKTVPHYVEDYYLLYGLKQYYNENTLRLNIARLKTAMECRFRHPSEALVKVESEDEYLKYRNLMFMHINMLILRDHLKIAARYDKRTIQFYNLDFAKEIRESLDTAEVLYRDAMPYWMEAKKYAELASGIKITTDLGFMESERCSIVKGTTDFEKIINGYLAKVEEKKGKLDEATGTLKE